MFLNWWLWNLNVYIIMFLISKCLFRYIIYGINFICNEDVVWFLKVRYWNDVILVVIFCMLIMVGGWYL